MGKGKMTEDILIDSKVSTTQCKLAVDALLSHALAHQAAKEQNELLPDRTEQHVWLVVAVKKMFPERKLKPFKIPLSHPLTDPRATPICLITKDPQREYKDLLESHNIRFISRVVGVEKLKGKFKPFEARRMLLKENGLFLADDRVVPLLPKLLGKAFFNAKKQPIPVCLKRKDLKGELERAVSSTYFHQNQGTCSSVKIGVLGQHSAAQLLQNLSTALPHVVKNIRENWDNIQSMHIKTSSSASLPIWNCRLDEEEGGRWDGLTRVPIPDNADEEANRGKKRTLESGGEPGKKKKKHGTTSTKKSVSTSQPSGLKPLPPTGSPSKGLRVAPPAASRELSKGVNKSAPESSIKESTKEPTEVRQKPSRASAVDFFGSDDVGDYLSPSKPSASKTPIPPKSVVSNQSPLPKDSVPMKSKSQDGKPSETKTILKSSKTTAKPTTMDVPAKAKHVKFATKVSGSKKRDNALGAIDKKVRSGGGKSASAKDRVLGKKLV